MVQDKRPSVGLRSAILPGRGQYYKGECVKATVLSFGFDVGVISTINTQIKLNQARKEYQNATTTAEATERYTDYNRWFKRRNFAAIAMGSVWVYSLIDALAIQPKIGSESNFILPPAGFTLNGNYPNLFSGVTQVGFTLDAPQLMKMEIFDLLGRQVQSYSASFSSGNHAFTVDDSALLNGVFFIGLPPAE